MAEVEYIDDDEEEVIFEPARPRFTKQEQAGLYYARKRRRARFNKQEGRLDTRHVAVDVGASIEVTLTHEAL